MSIRQTLDIHEGQRPDTAAPPPAPTDGSEASGGPQVDPSPQTARSAAVGPGPQAVPPGFDAALPASGLAVTGSGFAILLACCLAVAPEFSRQLLDRELLPDAGRYAASIQMLRNSLGLHGPATLAGWLAQVFLLLAAAAARRIRSVRRSGPEGVPGRFRAWGWLGLIWIIAAAATAMPLGPAVAAALVEVTETPFGPSGLGWWVVCGVAGLALTVPWAVLGMREQRPTAAAVALGLSLWAGSIGCLWLAQLDPRLPLLANAGWLFGTGLVLLAMLLAVRSSLREAAGLCPPARHRPRRRAGKPVVARQQAGKSGSAGSTAGAPGREPPEAAVVEDSSASDAAEPGGADRRLSKAERRRLRKLARNGRAA